MQSILASICHVGNSLINSNIYVEGLLKTKSTKTMSEIARSLGKDHDAIRRCLKKMVQERDEMRAELRDRVIQRIKNTPGRGAIIGDSTVAIKRYAQKIEGAMYQYAGTENAVGISVTAFLWTDMSDADPEPIDLFVWEKGDDPKTQTAIERAIVLAQGLDIKLLLMDAAFATKHAFKLLQETHLLGVMRFHCNRKVFVEGFGEYQLQDHPAFEFKRNRRVIVREILWHGMRLCCIATKRFERRQRKWTIRFLATNAPLQKALEYAQFYRHRWKIEPFFRTAKQKYGLQDCQARSLAMQEAHFLAVFLAYSNTLRISPQKPIHSQSRRKYIRIPRKKVKLKMRKRSHLLNSHVHA
jgi:hypothetical protein